MDGQDQNMYIFVTFSTLLVVGRVLRLRRIAYWQGLPVSTAYFSRAGLGYLGKGWIVRDTTTRRLDTGQTGSSTQAGTCCADLQLIGSSVADCQALTRHSFEQPKNKELCWP